MAVEVIHERNQPSDFSAIYHTQFLNCMWARIPLTPLQRYCKAACSSASAPIRIPPSWYTQNMNYISALIMQNPQKQTQHKESKKQKKKKNSTDNTSNYHQQLQLPTNNNKQTTTRNATTEQSTVGDWTLDWQQRRFGFFFGNGFWYHLLTQKDFDEKNSKKEIKPEATTTIKYWSFLCCWVQHKSYKQVV